MRRELSATCNKVVQHFNRIASMITRNDLAASDESREEMYKLSPEVISAIRKEFALPSQDDFSIRWMRLVSSCTSSSVIS
jgi:hypothetical protein